MVIPIVDVLPLLNQHFCTTSVKSLNFSCIDNVDQLQALFQNSLGADLDRIYQLSTKSLLLIHMQIRVATSQKSSNASSHVGDKCCEVSDAKDMCTTTAVYSHVIYQLFPFPLVKAFIFPIDTMKQYLKLGTQPVATSYSAEDLCWAPPLPFCPTSNPGNLLPDSIFQVKYYDVQSNHMHSRLKLMQTAQYSYTYTDSTTAYTNANIIHRIGNYHCS